MIKINQSPVLTSKHYGINEFMFDETLLYSKTNNFNDYYIENITLNKLQKLPKNNLSLDIDNHTKQNYNFAKKVVIDKTGKDIKYITFKPNQNLIDALEITIKKDIETKLIIKYLSDQKLFCSSTIKVNIEQNAKLDIVLISNLQNANANLNSLEINCDTNSQTNLHFLDFSANISTQNISANLFGNNVKFNLDSIYFGKDYDRLSLNYLINISGKECATNMNALGILDNYSQKSFIGTINFLEGSNKSVGEENEHCILLSKFTKSKSVPILLSHEEDVDGKHSSSCGKFDEDKIFYLTSRGLTLMEAKKLLVKAKLNKLINKIKDESLINEIYVQLDKYFESN